MATSMLTCVVLGTIFYGLVQCDVYYIKSSPDQACPSDNENCLTLSEFAGNFTSTNYTESDMTLVFLSGNHTLDSDLSFYNISSLTIMAKTSISTLTSKFESESIVVCNTSAHFEFESLKVIRITSLKFVGCARNTAKSVGHFLVEDSSFIGQKGNVGTALELHDVSAKIVNSLFSKNTGHILIAFAQLCQSFKLNHGSFRRRVTATSSGAIFSSRSRVTIEKTKFEENSAKIGAAMSSNEHSRITIINTTFVNNNASKFDLHDSCDGAVLVSDDSSLLSIEDSYFKRNVGGAVQVADIDSLFESESGVINITCTKFEHNIANWGGAVKVFTHGVTVTITDSQFMNNSAHTGGAIYALASDVYITISEFIDNSAISGGALFERLGTAITTGAKLYNSACRGGAVYISTLAEMTITDSTFIDNNAESSGGALYVQGATPQSRMLMDKCSFINNKAKDGGVIYSPGRKTMMAKITASMSTFENNTALQDGGVFRLHGFVTEIIHSEFSGNTAGSCGAVAYSSDGNLNMSKSHFQLNKANATGGVIYTLRGHVIASFTSFTSNTAIQGGVVWCHEISNVTFNNVLFKNNLAERYGGVINARDCFAVIGNSTFRNNRADDSGGAMNFNGGQTFIINSTLSHNRAGNDGGVIMSYLSDISIEECHFTYNEAVNEGGVMWNDHGDATIHQTSFESNSASAGGAIYTDQGQLEFNGTMFVNNKASAGAALWAKKSNAIRGHSANFTHNRANFSVIFFLKCTTSLINIDFSNNHGSLVARYSILFINGYSKMNNNLHAPHSRAVKRLSEGGALTAFQSEIHFNGTCELMSNSAEKGGALNMIESELHIHGDTILGNNRAIESGGGIHLDHSELTYSSEAVIKLHNNTASEKGGGVMAKRSSILVEVDDSNCTLIFDANQAKMGGGFYFEMDSMLVILKSSTSSTHNSIVTLTHNSAEHGGAVYVSDDGMCSLTTVNQCPFQALAMYGPMPVEFDSLDTRYQSTLNFFNNTAVSGESLFGGLLDRCTVSTFAEPNINNLNIDYSFSNGTEVTDGHEYLKMISNVEDRHISSHPIRVCFCRECLGTPDCSYQPEPIRINKDQQQKISISLSVVDQIDQPLKEATIYSHFSSGNFLCQNHIQSADGNCIKVEFSVESSNATEELILSVGDGPCEISPLSQARMTIEYVCTQCPVGFEEDMTSIKGCHCICDSQLYPFFTNCTGYVLIRDKNVWIDSIESNESSSAHRYLIHPYCPNNYCHPPKAMVEVNLNLPHGADSQCTNNRSGLLCGTCRSGFSLSLGSSSCITCPKLWPVTLAGITLGAAIGGIALVVLLLSFKLTVADGTLNGLIFYANIVGANVSIFLPLSTPNFMTVVISWMNLEMGFDVCFFEGMDMFWKTLIQLAFPVYLIVLVALVIFISERSRRFAQLIGNRNPVATLATLILLSYSKLLNNVIASMSSAVLKYPNGTSEVVWLPDASVGYLKGKHIALFLISLFILIAGIVYTVVLFCWQWFLQYQHWKVFSWTKHQKLCHFIEPYQAPYTAKHRYWTGLLLLVRVLLHMVSALNVNGDAQVTLLAIIVTVTILLLIKGILATKIYTQWPVDVLETIMYFNIVTFAALSTYYHDTGKNQAAIAYISVTITFILLLIVIMCHLYKYSCLQSTIDKCHTSIYDKIKVKVLKKEIKQAADQELNNPSKFKKSTQLSVVAEKKSETIHTIVEMRTVSQLILSEN